LLRANPPAAPSPSPDLWKRIEAQILAEQPPVLAPVPARPAITPSPIRSQWRSFGVSFGYSVLPVAAIAAGIVFFVGPLHKKTTQDAMISTAENTANVAAVSPKEREIVIEFPTAAQALAARQAASGVASESGKSEKRLAASIAKPAVRVAASRTASSNGEVRARRKVARLQTLPTVRPASQLIPENTTVIAAETGRRVSRFALQADTAAVPSRTFPDAATPAAPITPEIPNVAAAITTAAPANPDGTVAPVASLENTERAERKRKPVRVASVALDDAILLAREVPAERRVTEMTDKVYRHRTLFSYSQTQTR
jgi:hypothetical protein